MLSAIKNEFENRLEDFRESYTWEECEGLVRPIAVVGEMIDLAFSPLVAARAMQALRLIITVHPDQPIEWDKLNADFPLDNWREDWADLDAYNDTYWSELMERTHNLHAFAFYSVIPTWDRLSSSEHSTDDNWETTKVVSYVQDIVERLTRFTAMFPKGVEHREWLQSIEAVCLAATARLKLDEGESISVHELAALTRVSTKRVQNAIYSKADISPIVGKNGLFQKANAQRWLDAQGFLPSIWKEFITNKCWEANADISAAPIEVFEDNGTDEFLFVPEAKDGTVFSPTFCLRKGISNGPSAAPPYYTIGPKGAETNFTSYDEALEALSIQQVPRWRRPNENGKFGIVSAERWRRLTRAEIQSL